MKKTLTTVIILILSLLFLSSCTSLLYHPTHVMYAEPQKVDKDPEDVFIISKDRRHRLHAWYFRAKGPKGFVVQFHGNGQNLTSHYLSTVWMNDVGYSVLNFDYQGYGWSSGEPSPQNTVLDGVEVLKWVEQERKKIDPEAPLILFCQSLGTAVCLRTAYEVQSDIKIDYLIIDSGFHSYKSVASHIMNKNWLLWSFQWLPYLIFSDEWSPKDQLGQIKGYKLVIHGNQDGVVDYSLGERIYADLPEPKDFWSIDGGGHTDVMWREKGSYRKKLMQWLEKSINR